MKTVALQSNRNDCLVDNTGKLAQNMEKNKARKTKPFFILRVHYIMLRWTSY